MVVKGKIFLSLIPLTFNDSPWISHPVSRAHLPSGPLVSALCPCNLPHKPKPNKIKKKKPKRKEKKKNLVMEAMVWPRESHSLLFGLLILTGHESLVWSQASGL